MVFNFSKKPHPPANNDFLGSLDLVQCSAWHQNFLQKGHRVLSCSSFVSSCRFHPPHRLLQDPSERSTVSPRRCLPSVTEWWDSLTFTCGALETLLVEKHSQTRHLGNVGKNPTVSLVSTNFEFRSQEILLSMASPESSRSMSRA